MDSETPPPGDAALLRQFAEDHREDAFTELVGPHLDLVHSAAFRMLDGDSAAATDVGQAGSGE